MKWKLILFLNHGIKVNVVKSEQRPNIHIGQNNIFKGGLYLKNFCT